MEALLMQNFLFTYKNEHHYYVLESLYTHQIFRMPISILVNGDHLLNEYLEFPELQEA